MKSFVLQSIINPHFSKHNNMPEFSFSIFFQKTIPDWTKRSDSEHFNGSYGLKMEDTVDDSEIPRPTTHQLDVFSTRRK